MQECSSGTLTHWLRDGDQTQVRLLQGARQGAAVSHELEVLEAAMLL